MVSDSPGLVNFAIRLVNSVINLPDGQVNFFEEFKLQKNCEINLLVKMFLGLVEMIFGLVNVSFSLPEWQAVKMTFFAPWADNNLIYQIPGWLLASHTGVFRGARISSLPTNVCLTENIIPFPSLANHIVPSKFWKVDLDHRVTR